MGYCKKNPYPNSIHNNSNKFIHPNTNTNTKSHGSYPRIISMGYVTDKSSIYNPYQVTDLLIKLSAQICRGNNNIKADCLSNLKNNPRRWENNMKYFWNIATDLVRKNNDAWIVERTFSEAFAMVADYKSRQTGQSCRNMFVMNFNADTAKSVIRNFLRRFNLSDKPRRKFITSYIGVHRRMANPGFFMRLNRGHRFASEMRVMKNVLNKMIN